MEYLIIILLLCPLLSKAQTTNYHFSHTEKTSASPEAIWKLWTDVPKWKEWDKGMKEATLNGVFSKGAKGRLVPDKGPRAKFIVTDVKDGESYTFKTRIPLGWLVITRRLSTIGSETIFIHEVEFTGVFKKAFGKKLGSRYREMLPDVMGEIKNIVEKS